MAARHMRRVALVGYGDIARQHVAVLRDLGVEVVAACNRSEGGRERARTEGGIGRTYADIEEMLRHVRPEGVVCCPSLFQNFDVACRVIPFGIPMLLEKPPGTSLAELHELRRLARDHGTPVLVGVNRVWYSVLERAVQHAGGLDGISFVSVEWSESPRHLQARGFTPEQIDRRTVTNSLHGLAVLTHLAGAIPSPAIVGRRLGSPHRWVVALQGLSERGVLATFQSTWDSPAPWRLSFGSPERWYAFAPLEKCVVTTSRREPLLEIEPDELDRRYKPGLHGQARAFLALMNTGVLPDRGTLDSVVPAVELAETVTKVLMATAATADAPRSPNTRGLRPSVAITCGGVGNAQAD